MNYEQAKKTYENGRKYKHIGYKRTRHLWLKPDTVDGVECFTLSEIASKYYKDEKGTTCVAGAAQRDKYTMRVVAWIYPDRAEIQVGGRGVGVRGDLESIFGFAALKIKSAKKVGYAVQSRTKNAQRIEVGSGGRLVVNNDGSYGATTPVLERVHIKDAQKVLNDRIAAVRRMLKVRTMFNVFAQIDFKKWHDDYNQKHGLTTGRAGLPTAQRLSDELMAVREDDFETLCPLLAHSLVSIPWHNERTYRWYKDGFNAPADVALKAFVSFILRNKEGLRKLHGAIEYVQAEATPTGSGDSAPAG